MPREDGGELVEGPIPVERVEAELLPGLAGALEDNCARMRPVLVCMEPDPPRMRLLEGKGEVCECLRGAQPDVLVGAGPLNCAEPACMAAPQPARSAVGEYDKVCVGHGVEVNRVMRELDAHPELPCASHEDVHQAAPA